MNLTNLSLVVGDPNFPPELSDAETTKNQSISQSKLWKRKPDLLVVHSASKSGHKKSLKGLKKSDGKLQKKSKVITKKSKGSYKSNEKVNPNYSYVFTEIGTTCNGTAICKLKAVLLSPPYGRRRKDKVTSLASLPPSRSVDVFLSMSKMHLFSPNFSNISALPQQSHRESYLSLSACATRFQGLSTPNSIENAKPMNANSSASCECDFGFSASESPSDVRFIAHHDYEVLLEAGLSKEEVQKILDGVEAAIGDAIFTAFSNCTRGLHKAAPSTLIVNYALAPADKVMPQGKCKNLQAATENTTCVVVNSASTVRYSTWTDHANDADIENAIRRVVLDGCRSGSLAVNGAFACQLLLPNMNFTGIDGSKPTFVASISTGQEEPKSNALSILGAAMVFSFSFGILVLSILILRRCMISVAAKEEPDVPDESDVVVNDINDDVYDEFLTNFSQYEVPDDHSTLNGEHLFADIRPVDGDLKGDAAFLIAVEKDERSHCCKSASCLVCSSTTPFIATDGQVEVHVCNVETCFVCSSPSRRKGIEPLAFESYLPRSLLAASKPYDNTVTL